MPPDSNASVDVPDLNRETQRIPLSSVVLGSQRVPMSEVIYSAKHKTDTDGANPLVHGGQKLMPSVTRVLSRARDLYIFAEAYQRGQTTTQPLVAFVSFYRGDVKALETTPVAVTDGLDPKTKAVPLRLSLSPANLAIGRYESQLTVLDATAQKIAVWRAPIVVVP